MNLHFETMKELEDFIQYIGYSKTTAKPRKKAAPVKEVVEPAAPAAPTSAPAAPVAPAAPATVAPIETPAVTAETLIQYIQTNFADNIQGVKDMLARMGVAKVSEIGEGQHVKALQILQGV